MSTYHVVRKFPSKQALMQSVKRGDKNHIWEVGAGDVRKDGVYKVESEGNWKWEAEVIIQGGVIVNVR
jgi:hypothetical protein